MLIRSALLFCATAMAVSGPLAAQSYGPLPPLDQSEGTYEGEWEGAWQNGETWQGRWHGTYTDINGQTVAADYEGTFHGEGRFVSEDGRALSFDESDGWRESDSGYEYAASYDDAPRLGYSLAQRQAWLEDCQTIMLGDSYYYGDARYEDDDDGNGGLLGGLLGAVLGGVAGNQIANHGDRLLGTVIGAGVGGVAGAVIGSAIDGDGDNDRRGDARRRSNDEARAADYCEAYLRRYEATGYAGGVAYSQQVMMVVPSSRRHEVVTEEWVEEPVVEEVVHVTRRRAVVREPGKLTPIR